jgi:Ca2+-binding EF-hand superfamily protein
MNLDDEDLGSSNNQGNNSSSDDLLCYEDRSLRTFDLDDDGVITVDELEEFAGEPAVDDVLDILEVGDYNGIEYMNC